MAASALHLSMLAHGHERPLLGDFSTGFWVVTAISMLAMVWNLRFAPDAGAEISGRAPALASKRMTPAPRLR